MTSLWIVTRDSDGERMGGGVDIDNALSEAYWRSPRDKHLNDFQAEREKDSSILRYNGYTLSQVRVVPMEITDAMVEVACIAYTNAFCGPNKWRDSLSDFDKDAYRDSMRAALTAALAASHTANKGTT